MEPFEIYFSDLNQETQEAYLEYAGLNDPKEANLDVLPLATLDAPEPELTVLRLYSPITIDVSILSEDAVYDYNAEEFTLSGREATGYVDLVNNALEREKDTSMEKRGLMAYYYGSPTVENKVQYAYPTAEEYRGELYCVTVCRVKESLTPPEMAELQDFLTGQYSDGFGEGLEQREQDIMGGVGSIHLWQGDGKFSIRTEQELKGSVTPAKDTSAKAASKRSRDAR